MENNGFRTAVLAALVMVSIIMKAEGQIGMPCTMPMLNSFTPCLNYITGSSANGNSSPTTDCCDAFKSIMSQGVDCGCLIVTGNVPISLPFNRTLAISLPRACRSSLPVQCKASGVPIPAPGPVLFAPSPAPDADAPFSPRASKATAVLAPSSIETPPAPSPVVGIAPLAHPTSRSATIPSASTRLYVSFSLILPLFLCFLIALS